MFLPPCNIAGHKIYDIMIYYLLNNFEMKNFPATMNKRFHLFHLRNPESKPLKRKKAITSLNICFTFSCSFEIAKKPDNKHKTAKQRKKFNIRSFILKNFIKNPPAKK